MTYFNGILPFIDECNEDLSEYNSLRLEYLCITDNKFI